MTPTDGLDLAGQSERDLRDFLKAHGIAIPSGQLFVIEIRSKDDARYASRFATTTIYTRPQQMEMMIRVLTTFRLHPDTIPRGSTQRHSFFPRAHPFPLPTHITGSRSSGSTQISRPVGSETSTRSRPSRNLLLRRISLTSITHIFPAEFIISHFTALRLERFA